jgi:hypothetical protein
MASLHVDKFMMDILKKGKRVNDLIHGNKAIDNEVMQEFEKKLFGIDKNIVNEIYKKILVWIVFYNFSKLHVEFIPNDIDFTDLILDILDELYNLREQNRLFNGFIKYVDVYEGEQRIVNLHYANIVLGNFRELYEHFMYIYEKFDKSDGDVTEYLIDDLIKNRETMYKNSINEVISNYRTTLEEQNKKLNDFEILMQTLFDIYIIMKVQELEIIKIERGDIINKFRSKFDYTLLRYSITITPYLGKREAIIFEITKLLIGGKMFKRLFGKYIDSVLLSQIGGFMHGIKLDRSMENPDDNSHFRLLLSEFLTCQVYRDPYFLRKNIKEFIVDFNTDNYKFRKIDNPRNLSIGKIFELIFQLPDVPSKYVNTTSGDFSNIGQNLFSFYLIMFEHLDKIKFTLGTYKYFENFMYLRYLTNSLMENEKQLIYLESKIFHLLDNYKENKALYSKFYSRLRESTRKIKKFQVLQLSKEEFKDWFYTPQQNSKNPKTLQFNLPIMYFLVSNRGDTSYNELGQIIVERNRHIKNKTEVSDEELWSYKQRIDNALQYYSENDPIQKEFERIISGLQPNLVFTGNRIEEGTIFRFKTSINYFLQNYSHYLQTNFDEIFKFIDITRKHDFDLNDVGNLNIFDIHTFINKLMEIARRSDFQKHYKSGPGKLPLKRFIRDESYNDIMNKYYVIKDGVKITGNKKIANFLATLNYLEIPTLSLILAKIFLYEKNVHWNDRLSRKDYFIKTKIILDMMTNEGDYALLSTLPLFKKPKSMNEVERFCTEVVRFIIEKRCLPINTEEFRMNFYDFKYENYKYKKYILNWFFCVTLKGYYDIGNNFKDMKIINEYIEMIEKTVNEGNETTEEMDIDSFLMVNEFATLHGKNQEISKEVNKISHIKYPLNIFMSIQSIEPMYLNNYLMSVGFDYIMSKYRFTDEALFTKNTLTSESFTLSITRRLYLIDTFVYRSIKKILIEMDRCLFILNKVTTDSFNGRSFKLIYSNYSWWLNLLYKKVFLGVETKKEVSYDRIPVYNYTELEIKGIKQELYDLTKKLLLIFVHLFEKLDGTNVDQFMIICKLLFGTKTEDGVIFYDFNFRPLLNLVNTNKQKLIKPTESIERIRKVRDEVFYRLERVQIIDKMQTLKRLYIVPNFAWFHELLGKQPEKHEVIKGIINNFFYSAVVGDIKYDLKTVIINPTVGGKFKQTKQKSKKKRIKYLLKSLIKRYEYLGGKTKYVL